MTSGDRNIDDPGRPVRKVTDTDPHGIEKAARDISKRTEKLRAGMAKSRKSGTSSSASGKKKPSQGSKSSASGAKPAQRRQSAGKRPSAERSADSRKKAPSGSAADDRRGDAKPVRKPSPAARKGSGASRPEGKPRRDDARPQQGKKRPSQDPRKGGKRPAKGKNAPKGKAQRPRKRHTKRNVILVIVAVIALLFGIDALANNGKIHTGVTVGGLDVGGLTTEEAAARITENFDQQVSQGGDIVMYRDEATAQAVRNGTELPTYTNEEEAAEETTDESVIGGDVNAMNTDETVLPTGTAQDPVRITFDYDALESFNANPPVGPVFAVAPATIGAHVDARGLAEKAFEVGRGADFVFGRIAANTSGVEIDLNVKVDSNAVSALEDLLTSFLGVAMINPNIAFADGTFTATPGNDGFMVRTGEFEQMLTDALLSEDRDFTIPMGDVHMEVDKGSAERAAETAQAAIAQPVTLVYGGQTWELGSDFLGQAMSTAVTPAFFGNELTPYISIDKLSALIPTLEGMGDIGTPALNVRFAYDGRSLQHADAQNGIGPDYGEIAARMNFILFNNENLATDAGEEFNAVVDEEAEERDTSADDEARRVTMELVTSYPTLTYEDAHEMGLDTHLIFEYTTDFEGSSENKATNIKLISDLLTNTVIMPGEIFSINETAGECNEEKGFKEAGAILNGSITSEIGGGICAVATTVFNAAFRSGYPIVERYNHSNYMASYPDGLDAAISWPYLDLRFQNDTNYPVLLLVNYTDTTVTCSLWGIDPGYRVEFEQTSWLGGIEFPERTEYDSDSYEGTEYIKQYGAEGHSVVIQRTINNEDGNLLRQDSITSYYQPKAQITVKGTKPYG